MCPRAQKEFGVEIHSTENVYTHSHTHKHTASIDKFGGVLLLSGNPLLENKMSKWK